MPLLARDAHDFICICPRYVFCGFTNRCGFDRMKRPGGDFMEKLQLFTASSLEKIFAESKAPAKMFDHFSVFKNEIRSYHKLCLSHIWDSKLIPEITLGAMCRQNKQELAHFLKANGLTKTKITISKIPIR